MTTFIQISATIKAVYNSIYYFPCYISGTCSAIIRRTIHITCTLFSFKPYAVKKFSSKEGVFNIYTRNRDNLISVNTYKAFFEIVPLIIYHMPT